ncbi:MAG: hypothetical protein AB3N24_00195 [Leisingera sp.]
MTEITAENGRVLFPNAQAERHLIDPVAFGVAMAGGPLLVGVLGFPLILPAIAMAFGGPVYLAVGVPVMLIVMPSHRYSASGWAGLALVVHAALFLTILILSETIVASTEWPAVFFIFGLIFAPLWGAVSGQLYRWLERDFYKQTI